MSLGLLRALLITDPLIVLATIVMGSISLLTSLFDPTGRKQHAVARLWAAILLKVGGVRVTVEGLEKISPDGSYVFVANHLSYMDTPVVLASIPVQFRFLAKQGLFKIPFLGYHLHRAGHVPVPREDARASVRVMQEAARIIRERGVSILVFPEGGRAEDGELQEFKEGAAYIAIKAGAPAVPIVLRGTREVLPMGSINVRPGKVRLIIGDPIPTDGMSLKERGPLTDTLRARIVEMLGEAAIAKTVSS
jgi:1-acyl-sn-glycerol-3-phosphate acyltransferase